MSKEIPVSILDSIAPGEYTIREYGGQTSPQPYGTCPHEVFRSMADYGFRKFSRENPHLRFWGLSVDVLHHVLNHAETGRWLAFGIDINEH